MEAEITLIEIRKLRKEGSGRETKKMGDKLYRNTYTGLKTFTTEQQYWSKRWNSIRIIIYLITTSATYW